jgi:hypothetical protein
MVFFLVYVQGPKTNQNCKALLQNFLLGKKEHNTRLKAKWDDCCAQKKVGRLSLIDLEDE